MNNLNDSFLKLEQYCRENNYKGYSLYDSHLSNIPFEKFGSNVSFIINQINKRSPINFRKIINVNKEYNPKGMGLFLNSYLTQKELGNPLKINHLDKSIDFFFNWLESNFSKGYSGYCWGYNYPWPKKDGSIVKPFYPTSVVTGFNIRSIFKYYLITNDKRAIKIIKKAKDFIINDIPFIENKRGICFSYTTSKQDITINANLLAGEILAYSDYVENKNSNINTIKKILDFTTSYQNENGSWYYSYDIKTKKPKIQIDFHQGYVLESIKRICKFSEIPISDYKNIINNGLLFYYNNQFSKEGYSFWRIPSKWPVDIHNQSQGIITFSNFKNFNPKYLDFSKKIANWTITNMQNKIKGNFYYQKWPIITNKVSYMRWNQGWMMVAISTLMKNILKK